MNANDQEALEPFKTFIRNSSGISDAEFESMAYMLRPVHFTKGEVVLEIGAVCAHAFHVTRGLLRVATLDKNGDEHIVQFAPEGWFASDRSSMYFQEPSHLRIDAIEETDAVMVGQDFFDSVASISDVFRKFNTTLLHNHIRHMQDRIALLLGARADERYQKFISLYPDLLLRVPQWMIASYLGITPESLSRVRRDLAERNFNTH
ncbi:MAG: Crp/Fnr family transcriptional regulator [Flavobacteriales bacterium]|nr:Crp/Fnr family transcriptional regulator [Flavobacteriales bacterium]